MRLRTAPVLLRCAVLGMALVATHTLFRSAPKRALSQETLQSSAELVKVDVSVSDKRGNFVAGLAANDFRILDNGTEQPVVFFMPVEAPAQVLVMIETGPAVYLIHSEHLTAAFALLDGLDPADQVALVSYNEAPRQLLPFTSDKSLFLSALGKIDYGIGMADLNLYASLSQVLDWLKPLRGKRALVLLSTGLDSSQPSRWDALAAKLRGEDIVIFPVALGAALRGSAKTKSPKRPSRPNSDTNLPSPSAGTSLSFAKSAEDLAALAAITGGRAYFPSSRSEFVTIYREIAAALRHQYVLGLVPSHDGRYHSLSVELSSGSRQSGNPDDRNPQYHISARPGYLAPAP